MHKNQGPFLAFNDVFFAKHQRLLLRLLNAPVIKVWTRWILRIRTVDCLSDTQITEIYANRFSFGDRHFFKDGQWQLERTTDFRTHPKYGKRVYYAFRPLWWAMHAWDELLADYWIPSLSFGFSTLTVYPDAGTTGSTSCDGQLYTSTDKSSWALLVAQASADAKDMTSNPNSFVGFASGSVSGHWNQMVRFILLFDTSALTSGASISAATLSIRGTGTFDDSSWAPNINIYTTNPASNTTLALADFSTFGSTAQCDTAITFAGWSTAGYNAFALNATGLGNISKTAVTKFGTRNAGNDAANSSPTWVDSGTASVSGNNADAAGTSTDPKLVITYTASTDYPITAAQGSFTLTGEASAFRAALHAAAAAGAFVFTGQATLLSLGKTVVAAVGSFTLTGRAALVNAARRVVSAAGSFTLTGEDSAFIKAMRIIAAQASIGLTGQTIRFRLNGWLVQFSDKFSNRSTSSSDKYSGRGTSSSDKYHQQ